MRFQSQYFHLLSLFASAPLILAVALPKEGGGGLRHQQRRNLKNTKSDSCVVVVAELLALEPGSIQETVYECELDPSDSNGYTGITRAIKGSPSQMASIASQFKAGGIVSGETKLVHGTGAAFDDDDIFLPPGLVIGQGKRTLRRGLSSRRRLAITKGNKPILAVRVTDSTGKVHPRDASQMSDDIFGSFGDPVNLKSQLAACSFNQLNVTAGLDDPDPREVAPGMVEVTIPVPLEGNSRSTIRNAVTTAVQTLLGHSLPGPYQQVMYNLEGCYVDCGWAAYAYINSWNSVYQGNYYYMTGVQVHELGHNFNLAHSGGLNGATYTDHTCLMGNPLYSDDVGKMCFNPAKNYQLDWYNDNNGKMDVLTSSSTFTSELVTIVGIAEYNIKGANQPVTVKLETGRSTDFFVGFNRATGANSQNDEADNEVTIIEANGGAYSQSYLKAHLVQGESYDIISEFGGTTKTITVTAVSIDLNVADPPGVATVCIAASGQTCTPPAPTVSPTPNPTANPTIPPPTSSPVPPTPPPTDSPTKSPTPPPTPAPVICSLAGVGESCRDSIDCCSSLCSGGKPSDRVCLVNGPTPPPAPTPPTTSSPVGGCDSAGASCGNCCNGCSGGKPANRVCL